MKVRFPKLVSFTLALCLALLASCGGKATLTPSPTPALTPSPQPTSTPEPVLTWTEQVFQQEYTASDGTVVMTTCYTFPDIQQPGENPAWQSIHDFYAQEGEELSANAAQQEEWALGDYDSAEATGFPFSPYVDEQSYEFTQLTDQWASVLRTHYMNSGGAYPTTFYFTDLWDLSTGKRLTLAECFDTDSDTALARVLEQVLDLNSQGAYGGQVWDEETIRSGFDPNLFYFTEEGLVIPFQSYSLGVRDALLPSQAIPYSALEDILWIW